LALVYAPLLVSPTRWHITLLAASGTRRILRIHTLFELYSLECVERLSEKSQTGPQLSLRDDPNNAFRPILASLYRPNPRSERR
jgi:hypothetical protein